MGSKRKLHLLIRVTLTRLFSPTMVNPNAAIILKKLNVNMFALNQPRLVEDKQ